QLTQSAGFELPDSFARRRRLRCRPSGGAGSARASVGNRPTTTFLGTKVELEIRRDRAQFAQGAGFELSDALARDAEARPDFFERLRWLAVESEAKCKHAAHARVQAQQRLGELGLAELLRGRFVRSLRMDVFDQVGVHALAVTDRGLE